MPTSWIAWIVSCWFLGGLLGSITEKTYFKGTEMSVLSAFLRFDVFKSQEIWGFLSVPLPNTDWLGNLGDMVIWNYSFFESTWGMGIRGIFMALCAAVVLTVVMEVGKLIRG